MSKETDFGLLKNYGIVKTPHKTGRLVEVIYKTIVVDGKPVKVPRKTTELDKGEFSYLQMRMKYFKSKGHINLQITY
jgi:hypothetical protein